MMDLFDGVTAGQWFERDNLRLYWQPSYIQSIEPLAAKTPPHTVNVASSDDPCFSSNCTANPAQSIDAQTIYETLACELCWQQGEVTVYGKRHLEPRLSAYYGEPNSAYRYSGKTVSPRPWHPLLLTLKHHLETTLGTHFNAVLCNYYRNGQDGMGWHSDNEPELGPAPTIASLSFGSPRKFNLRHKTGAAAKLTFELGHGDLLVMAGTTQQFWQHNLTKTQRPVDGRINLTFRAVEPR